MKRLFTAKRFLTGLSILIMLGISLTTLTNSGGAPGGYTNAPSEANCTSCHTGSLQTTGTNYNNISLSGSFTGGGYIPDSSYTITLSYSHSGKSKFGFQLTCLDNDDDMAGSFTNLNNKTSMTSATVSGATRSYMRQTSSGNSGSGSISWSFKWTAPSSNLDTVVFYTIVNSANGSGTGNDIIIAREFKIAPSSLLPVVTASATNTIVCQGVSVSLTGAATNTPTNWQWSLLGGAPSASTSQNPSVVYNVQGNYKAVLRVKNAKGYSLPDTVSIVVNAGPTAYIAGAATRFVCPGDSIKIEANTQGGNSYIWNNGTSGSVVWAKAAGNYKVVVTGSNGCSRTSNIIKVEMHAQPSASLTSNASVFNDSSCTNSNINLTASPSTFDSFYFYENNQLVNTSATNTYTGAFTSTTTYGIVVKDSNKCFSEIDGYTVVAKNQLTAPSVQCGTVSPSTIEFEWDGSQYHNGFEISTNNGNSWLSPSSGLAGNSHLITGLSPEDTVELWVRAKDVAPCYFSSVGNKKCVADTCTQLQASVQHLTNICYGDLLEIEVNGLAGKNYGLTFDGGAIFADTLFEFNPSVSSTFILGIIDSNFLACPANEIEIPVVVDRIFDIDLKQEKIGAYCIGETVRFSANDTIETFDFYWNNNLVQSGTSNKYSNTEMTNNDSVFVIVKKGICVDTSLSEYVSIEGVSDASFTYTRAGSVYSFVPSINSYKTYTWDFGDGSSVSNDVSPSHDFASSEGKSIDVSLEITTENDCLSDSSENLKMPKFSSVEILRSLGLEIYPNPVRDILTVQNTRGISGLITVQTIEGKLLTTEKMNGANTMLNLSSLESGVYIFKIIVDNKETSVRLFKD